jgi:hypothetical protein
MQHFGGVVNYTNMQWFWLRDYGQSFPVSSQLRLARSARKQLMAGASHTRKVVLRNEANSGHLFE